MGGKNLKKFMRRCDSPRLYKNYEVIFSCQSQIQKKNLNLKFQNTVAESSGTECTEKRAPKKPKNRPNCPAARFPGCRGKKRGYAGVLFRATETMFSRVKIVQGI